MADLIKVIQRIHTANESEDEPVEMLLNKFDKLWAQPDPTVDL